MISSALTVITTDGLTQQVRLETRGVASTSSSEQLVGSFLP